MRQSAHCFGLCIRKGLEPDIDRTVIILSGAIFEVAVYFVSNFVQAFQKELLIWHFGPLPMSFFTESAKCLVTEIRILYSCLFWECGFSCNLASCTSV